MAALSRRWSALSSGVGRRTLGAFLVATLIPALTIALLAINSQSQSSAEHASRELMRSSETVGLSLLQQLNNATTLLENAAVRRPRSAQPDALSLVPVFESLQIRSLPEYAVRPAKPLILLEDGQDPAANSVLIAVPVGAAADYDRNFLVGALSPEYLWSITELSGGESATCILRNDGRRIFCPDSEMSPPRAALAARTVDGNGGMFEWRGRSGGMITRDWELFLPSRYEAEPWRIIQTIRPQPTTLWSGIPNLAFLPIVVALILSPLLVAMIQIRRTMQPIDDLIEGVGRIARLDYDSPIAEKGAAEFARLAKSINSMSFRIKSQIATLNSFSDIDRALLAEKNLDSVCEQLIALLASQPKVIRATIALINQRDRGQVSIIRNHRGTTIIDRVDTRLTSQDITALEQIGQSGSLEWKYLPDDARDDLDTDFGTYGMPVLSNGALRALLIVNSHDSEYEKSTHILEFMKGCQERLALAIKTIDHDQQLKFHASHDELTELANKRMLGKSISELVAAGPDSNNVVLLYIDLDAFKAVNDISGHAVGDRVLGIAGQRIQRVASKKSTVARIGGDEFAVLIPDLYSKEGAAEIADEIIHALNRPVLSSGIEHQLGASIGIARLPEDGDTLDTLLFRADLAMYEAKRAGRNTWKYYNPSMKKAVQARVSFEKDLRAAVEKEEFNLYVQPQMDVQTGRIVGGEVLLRWFHDSRGPVPPMEFIPVAEETGLIIPLGEWVMLESAKLIASWQKTNPEIQKVAVNVSVRQFLHTGFRRVIDQAIAEAGAARHSLEIEITESHFANDAQHGAKVCDWLNQRGVSIAIDDFGTGYSSLSYLNALPFQTLKIDRSFIDQIGNDVKDTTLVDMIIDLAKHLDKKVVAEGVTSLQQLNHLRNKGCELAQGFMIARPMPPEAFVKSIGATPLHEENESLTTVLRVVK